LLPGDYSYTTNSDSLMRMLRQKTDLPSSVLEKDEMGIQCPKAPICSQSKSARGPSPRLATS
jgi:hypothetical protein